MEISIIIPVYNKVKYLQKLLNMVINQTFKDYECILIDDGSTDGSEIICDEVSQSDSRFTTVHIGNGGVSHARNVGLDMANGEYITFIDSDDELHDDYLKNMYDCMINSKADLFIGNHADIWDNREDIIQANIPYESGIYRMKDILPDFAEKQKRYGIYGWCWSKMFSKKIIAGHRFNEELNLAEDFDFYLNIYPCIRTVYFDDKPFYYYRQLAENSSVVFDDGLIDYFAQLRVNIRYRNFLKEMGAWSDNNQAIVNELLNNYMFFTLFHCPLECFSDRFKQTYNIYKTENISLIINLNFQGLLLQKLKNGQVNQAKIIMTVYRGIRKMVRGNG